MVHWSLLIIAFVLGIGTGCVIIYQVVKAAARVEGAIEQATRGLTPFN